MRTEKLPEYCYARLISDNSPIKIIRGESGYYPQPEYFDVEKLNRLSNVTPEQQEAMLVGSMFGWDVPGANPDVYIGRRMKP